MLPTQYDVVENAPAPVALPISSYTPDDLKRVWEGITKPVSKADRAAGKVGRVLLKSRPKDQVMGAAWAYVTCCLNPYSSVMSAMISTYVLENTVEWLVVQDLVTFLTRR